MSGEDEKTAQSTQEQLLGKSCSWVDHLLVDPRASWVDQEQNPIQPREKFFVDQSRAILLAKEVGRPWSTQNFLGSLHEKPNIHEEKVDETLELLILASRRLWDVFPNDEAVGMIEPIQDPEEAAQRLMQKALDRGSADNITVVVVRFHA
ncbi:probable protein phosphatase 2C 41 [Henckelia pumila]|uniref:probable protein phosphatase 2C 41 n=1 Tax=Henckelia pumila TaxID=405737 RepID=UPI003C6E5BE4